MFAHRAGLSLIGMLTAFQLARGQTMVDSVFDPNNKNYYGDAVNWLPAGIPNNSPGTNYNVTIASFIVMNVDATVSSFTLDGAYFRCVGHSLTVEGTATINGGEMSPLHLEAYDQPAQFIILGALTNFDTNTRTLTSGTYFIGDYVFQNNQPTLLQFPGADIVHNASKIVLGHPRAQIMDENGNNGLRNFTHNTATGTFGVADCDFSTSGDLTNDGQIWVNDGALTINGELTNLDPVSRTLTGGTYQIDGMTKPARLIFHGGDVVNNAANVKLSHKAELRDENGNDALRNFTNNLSGAGFTINYSYSFTAAGDFNNAGQVSIYGGGGSPAHFTVPPNHRYLQTDSGPGTSLINAVFTGQMEIAGGLFFVNAFAGYPAPLLEGDLIADDALLLLQALTVTGSVHLTQNSVFLGARSDQRPLTVNGDFHANGILQIQTPYEPFPAAITIVQTGGTVIGLFANAPNGARVVTADGQGSFLVSYSSNAIVVSEFQVPARTQLLNISTRASIGQVDNILIGGFMINGTQPKRIMVRALGPSLSGTVPGALADPVLELHDSTGLILASNNDWRAQQESEIIATGLVPTSPLEAALIATLPANYSAYTAIVRGVNDGTGIGVVEVYDLDRTADSRPINLSTRGLVQIDNSVLIGGLIAIAQKPMRVIVRAVAPSLPMAGTLSDPSLALHDENGTQTAFNDNWRSDQEDEILATGIPPQNDLESAIVLMLPTGGGSYTAVVQGQNGSSGIAVVEIYDLND